MRAYFKNGKSIKISREQAAEIADMRIKGEEDVLVTRSAFAMPHRNVIFFIDIEEIIAMR